MSCSAIKNSKSLGNKIRRIQIYQHVGITGKANLDYTLLIHHQNMNSYDHSNVDFLKHFTYVARMIKSLDNSIMLFVRICVPAIAALILSLLPVNAASSDWQDLGGGSARLVAVLDPTNNRVSGAVEIKLKPGWKTYWKNPGSSGIPPEFNFSKSEGFSAGEVKFPTPRLITAAGTVFAGYKDEVAFPFEGELLTSAGGHIRLNLFVGICEEICIPAQAKFELPVSKLLTSDPEAMQIISAAKLSLPTKATGQAKILNVSNGPDGTLSIKVDMEDATGSPALFVEGPDHWYLTPAKLLSQANKIALFELDLSDVPKDADPLTAQLRYTLVSGKHGYELER